MIDISNLNFYYGSSQILFDVSLKAKNKEITCLMYSNFSSYKGSGEWTYALAR